MNSALNLTLETIHKFFSRGLQRALYNWAQIIIASAGKGWIDKQDAIAVFSKDKSQRQAYRIINKLISHGLLEEHKSKLVVTGKKVFGNKGRRIYFDNENVESYKNFITHIVEQQALLVQLRYRYTAKNSKSSKMGSIENPMYKNLRIDQIGAALSSISKYNNKCKSFNYRVLKHNMKKEFKNLGFWSREKIYNMGGKDKILSLFPCYILIPKKHSFFVRYRLASTYSFYRAFSFK